MKARLLTILLLLLTGPPARAQTDSMLRFVQTVTLAGVEGRIDHLSVDLKGERLFVAALGNNTAEVIDLRAGKRIRSLTGFHEPQGVAFVGDYNKLFVANAKGGACDILDGSSLKPIKSVKFSDDADNIRYDAKAHAVYVGYGSGALGIIDAANGEQRGAIKLAAHPESFQLEQSGSRIFVNTPDAGSIVVLDREKKAKLADWSFPKAKANYPMALDEKHHRLFVGFRKPATFVVFDTESGKVVADLPTPADPDDIFYDASRHRIYISGGEGIIGVVQQQDSVRYTISAKIPTASGARTSLFVPELSRLYLAVPHRGTQNAEIRVFEAMP